MIIYEVNLEIDSEIQPEFRKWLEPHIEEILKIDGFTKAELFEQESSESESSNKSLLTVHYHLTDREKLEVYFNRHAATLREDGIKRFGSRFKTSRRILQSGKKFSS